MKEYFVEVLYVIALSKRTQWAIILGLVFFLCILLAGDYFSSHLQFTGLLKSYEEMFAHKILRRYDQLAFATLISFWAMAIKFYQRDKKKYLQ